MSQHDRFGMHLLVLPVFIVWFAFLPNTSCAQKANIEGKIVVANLDRYDAVIRFGKTRRTIKPNKATLLTPKTYPITLEYWSGNTKNAWQKQTINAAGVYGFNFKNGKWVLASLKQGATARRPRPSANVLRQRVVRNPVRRGSINADRARWSPLARVGWAAASIYQFVRDESDRDAIRDLIVRGRLEDLRDLERWIDESDSIAVPYREELKDSLRELGRLTDDDWKIVDTADVKDWDQARVDLGDLVSDDQWNEFNDDFSASNTDEFWQADTSDLDLDQIDFAENVDVSGNLDISENMDLSENFDVGDLGIDNNNYDLGSFDDFGGYDGVQGVDAADFGGGEDFGGADFGDADMGDFGGGEDFGGDDF